jgi:glycosyltransferase involved in cell wall biosynthesis
LRPVMRKPRIAFFIDRWRPGSGSENQLQGLLSHLAPDYIDAHLYTLRIPLDPEHRELFPCPVDCLGIGSLKSPSAVGRLPGIAARLRRGKFDAAMIYFVDSNLYLVPACRLAGIPAVVINRRDMGYWYEPGLLRMVNFVNRWATHFLVNAEAVKQQVILHEHFAPERIHVIPNGLWDREIRLRTMNSDRRSLPAGFPEEGPVVGITASLRNVKRIDRFLEMAARVVQAVPEARFVIAGRGRLQGSLQEKSRELGLADRVHFLGQVDDVPALLGHLNVGVLTSDSEGLSNSLVEYGLAGVPAVAFAVGGNPEVILDGQTGFLAPPGDTRALADRVIRILEDEDLHRRLSLAAREYCETTYSPDRVRGLTLDFFASLQSSRRGDR